MTDDSNAQPGPRENPDLHPDDQAWAQKFGANQPWDDQPAPQQPAPQQPPPGQPYPGIYGAPSGAGGFPPPSYGGIPAVRPMTQVSPNPDIGTALKWAWGGFSANAGVVIAAAALWAMIIIGTAIVASMVLVMLVLGASIVDAENAEDFNNLTAGGSGTALTIAIGLIMTVIGATALSCWLNGVITIADGCRPALADFFRARAFVPILLVTLIVGIVSLVADVVFSTALGLPVISTVVALAISLLTMWMVYFAADTNAPVGESLSSGFNLATGRFLPTLAVFCVSFLLTIAGLLALIVGLLVAVPVSTLLTLYYFRSLTNRPIAV